MKLLSIIFILNIFIFKINAQKSNPEFIEGKVIDSKKNAIENVVISDQTKKFKIFTDKNGYFNIDISKTDYLEFEHISFEKKNINISDFKTNTIIELIKKIVITDEVVIRDKNSRNQEISTIKIDPKSAIALPSPFGDFNKILATIPGVVSNNELSSTYSVRGGNYDENLVYVNGMEIYRPMIVKAGQQEGLSFVNPNMVSDIQFSTGGWEAKYGDKLSSVLNIKYKTPSKFAGSATGSLLGASIHLEAASKNEKTSIIIGYRNKSSRYLLNTLPVKGQYFPVFHDLQSFITTDLTKKNSDISKRTTLSWLSSYAYNKYNLIPQSQTTVFGTASNVLSLNIGFEGTEKLYYETFQNSLKLSHRINKKLKADFLINHIKSEEIEYSNIESGYKLCEVNIDPNQPFNINDCQNEKGLGTFFNYARNSLQIQMLSHEQRWYYAPKKNITIEWGLKIGLESIKDKVQEYAFQDSSDYVTITNFQKNQSNLQSIRTNHYVQIKYQIDTNQQVTLGVRASYWTLNKQYIISPSMQYDYKPKWKKDVHLKIAAGIYRQPPFFREMRDFSGKINQNLKAQNSAHFIIGSEYNFIAWGRNFKLTNEIYYKYLWDIVPYDMDNVRLRYYAKNAASGFATGFDTRISGEFIKGVESWFGLSIMQTKEKIDSSGIWYKRPTNQLVTFNMFFQDHLPNRPSMKMYLNLIFGTGLPFGPPNDIKNRAKLVTPSYRRVDIGISKLISLNDKKINKKSKIESIWLGAEILNVIAAKNTISYIWIKDFSNNQYAVPNTLSQRFLNLKAIINF